MRVTVRAGWLNAVMTDSAAARVAAILQIKIRNGVLGSGQLLPSAPDLAAEYAITGDIARVVLNVLVRDGLAVAVPGRGYAVAGDPFAEAGSGGRCAYQKRPGYFCPNQTPQFMVKLLGADDRDGRLACWEHLPDVIWRMREDHGGYEGAFVLWARPWHWPGESGPPVE